ncbi:MAG TPA: threonine synthase [Candidatus Eisenbacteria bacterium]|nr:threonine synthase [Candidatus Eisenbacteria bacterium]
MHYLDPSTGRSYPLDEARWRADNGHYLNLAPGPGLTRRDIEPGRRSVWRYARALAVGVEHAVSLGEGFTPLVDGRWHDAPVRYKLEFMMPTGSFKDRGMTVMVIYLRSRGVTRVLEDSSGNAGASLSAYAAAAGLTCRILVPETASYPKIAQIAAGGAEVVTIKGSRQDVAEAALRQSAEMFYASHNWQPFFVEGMKTLAYELWEQLGFRAPDNLVVPLGYGSNVLGAERGFDELSRRGEVGKSPRLFGVQAANCAPYQAAFAAGGERLVPTDILPTVAEGIATAKPTRVAEVLRAVRVSGGAVVAVSEAEIVAALRDLARRGLYVEPTSATAAAGLTRLLAEGVIRPDESTVLVLTGSGLKASAITGELLGLRARSE